MLAFRKPRKRSRRKPCHSFLIVHGTEDAIVPVAQARRLVAALHDVGVEVTYIEFPEAGHDVFAWERIGSLALDFLGRHLEPEH